MAAQGLHMAAQGLHMAAQGLHMVTQGLHMAAQGPGWPQESPGAEFTCPLEGRMSLPGAYHQPSTALLEAPMLQTAIYQLSRLHRIRDCKDFQDA